MAKSYRKMYRFWLDIGKRDERALASDIAELKRSRAFSQTIRDGIRLICDLRRGNVGVLLELFPHVAERLTAQQDAAPADLMAKLTRIEAALGSVQVQPNAMRPPTLDAPDLDDSAFIAVDTPTKDGSSAVDNLLAAFDGF